MIELEQINQFIKAIDNKNIDEIKTLKNNIISKDITFDIYRNNLLTSERLNFIIKKQN